MCSDGPGAIVKKITNEKSVDRLLNFCYTIIVKGRDKNLKVNRNVSDTCQVLPLDTRENIKKHKKDIDTN